MDIVPDITKRDCTSKIEIEQVQQEQKEYLLLGTFLRTKGLNLFYYNPQTEEIKEAPVKYSDTLHLYRLSDKWITIDWESQKCTVDSKVIYFECLNMKNAIQRVNKYKKGIIKELSNLRIPNPDGIKFY